MCFNFIHSIFIYPMIVLASIVISLNGMGKAPSFSIAKQYSCPYQQCDFTTHNIGAAKIHVLAHTNVKIKCTLCTSLNQEEIIKGNIIKRLGRLIVSARRPRRPQEPLLAYQTFSFAAFAGHWESHHKNSQSGSLEQYLLGQYPDWRILGWVEQDAVRLKEKPTAILPNLHESTFSLALNRSIGASK